MSPRLSNRVSDKLPSAGLDLMNGTTKLALRIFTTYTFGLLPFLANLLVNVMVGTVTYYSVFHVSDLMYFTLTICGATLFDLFVESREHRSAAVPAAFDLVSMYAFLILTIIAALLLGLSSHYIAEPPASGPYEAQMQRLVAGGIIVAAFALVFSIALETRLCLRGQPPTLSC